MNVLKALAIVSYSNTHYLNMIYDQLSLIVSTMNNSVICINKQ